LGAIPLSLGIKFKFFLAAFKKSARGKSGGTVDAAPLGLLQARFLRVFCGPLSALFPCHGADFFMVGFAEFDPFAVFALAGCDLCCIPDLACLLMHGIAPI
jgi:hypothetical protein